MHQLSWAAAYRPPVSTVTQLMSLVIISWLAAAAVYIALVNYSTV